MLTCSRVRALHYKHIPILINRNMDRAVSRQFSEEKIKMDDKYTSDLLSRPGNTN